MSRTSPAVGSALVIREVLEQLKYIITPGNGPLGSLPVMSLRDLALGHMPPQDPLGWPHVRDGRVDRGGLCGCGMEGNPSKPAVWC